MNDEASAWGTHEVPIGSQLRLSLGSLDLWVQHLPNEWRIARIRDADPMRDTFSLKITPLEPLPVGIEQERYATERADTALTLIPRTADRPFVVRPSAPLSLVASDSAAFYCSTPMWIALSVGGATLGELPTSRPNDTWFGDSTRSGQLCYAGRTKARLSAAALLQRPGRIYTEVRVVNHGVDPLRIERVHLPLPHNRLGISREGAVWTPTLTLERQGDEPDASLRIGALGAAFRPIGDGPRRTGTPSILVRALSALLT
jgi:hypothetical protein